MNDNVLLKICGRCQIVKNISDFYIDNKANDGRYYWCKSCSHKHYKNYIEKLRHNPTIYGIYCLSLDKYIYIGQTTLLDYRVRTHKNRATNPNNPYYNMNLYQHIRFHGWDNFRIDVINDNPNDVLTEDIYCQAYGTYTNGFNTYVANSI